MASTRTRKPRAFRSAPNFALESRAAVSSAGLLPELLASVALPTVEAWSIVPRDDRPEERDDSGSIRLVSTSDLTGTAAETELVAVPRSRPDDATTIETARPTAPVRPDDVGSGSPAHEADPFASSVITLSPASTPSQPEFGASSPSAPTGVARDRPTSPARVPSRTMADSVRPGVGGGEIRPMTLVPADVQDPAPGVVLSFGGVAGAVATADSGSVGTESGTGFGPDSGSGGSHELSIHMSGGSGYQYPDGSAFNMIGGGEQIVVSSGGMDPFTYVEWTVSGGAIEDLTWDDTGGTVVTPFDGEIHNGAFRTMDGVGFFWGAQTGVYTVTAAVTFPDGARVTKDMNVLVQEPKVLEFKREYFDLYFQGHC